MKMIGEDGCPAADDPCTGCSAAGSGRREFLRDAAGLALGLFLGLGARPAEAEALARPLEVRSRSGAMEMATYAIPAADGVSIDREREVIIARFRGKVYAFGLSCPHRHTALHWIASDGRFQCPKHHSRYTPDGTYVSGRATRSMDRYVVARRGGSVVVDTDRLLQQDQDAAGWAAAFIAA
ncbi:MAG: Rieske [2Fe-2S] iron-sulfur protein [Gemmatimonadetes bacterium]|nr:Rieske [2Fe-2S] iron-sulfur protein [Gemmatimonadota bacterium]